MVANFPLKEQCYIQHTLLSDRTGCFVFPGCWTSCSGISFIGSDVCKSRYTEVYSQVSVWYSSIVAAMILGCLLQQNPSGHGSVEMQSP